MNFLPSELLLEIFKHLSSSDLLALTSLCTVFDETISNSKLVHKLLLNFRKLNGEAESIGSRRYINLNIGFYKPNVHHSILQNIGSNLTRLSFKSNKFKLDSLRKIINLTPNVTSLSFERITLSDVPKAMKRPFPELFQTRLTLKESDPRILRILSNCEANHFGLHQSSEDSYVDFTDVIRFLRSQTQLKTLEFSGFCKTSLFTDDALDKVNLNLESVSVKDSLFHRTVHLKSFIEGQWRSLTRAEFSALELFDVSTILNRLKNLKCLTISDVSLNYLEPLPRVEELTVIGQKVSEEIFDKFPSVKRLRLKRVRKKSILNNISKCMKELESLEVEDGSISELNIETVKVLSLKNIDSCSPDFSLLLNPNIEHLSIENCSSISDEVIESISQSLNQLKSLNINQSGRITNKSLESIQHSLKLLEKLTIISQNDLNWKLLSSRKNLKLFIRVK